MALNRRRSAAAATGGQVAYELGSEGTLLVRLSGPWRLGEAHASAAEARSAIAASRVRRVSFDTREIAAWDSALLTFLTRLLATCRELGVPVELAGLPAGVARLIALAQAAPARAKLRGHEPPSWLARTGETVLSRQAGVLSTLRFVGEVSVAFVRLVARRARLQRAQFAQALQQSGPRALGIVALISFLIGLILAFMGAVQLLRFGAQIYVADLVTLGVLREMGPIMTAIVMAGRTGAAFAAQLGTMKVNQELDALTTLGLTPIEYLVLPRILALSLIMPLLCLYSDFAGILGGIAVSGSMLHLSFAQYWNETVAALRLSDLALGLSKAGLFGLLIAGAGCLCGIRSGNSASAVGDATTRAVVSSIVLIIVSDGLLAVVCHVWGI